MWVIKQLEKQVQGVQQRYLNLWASMKTYALKCKRGYEMPYR